MKKQRSAIRVLRTRTSWPDVYLPLHLARNGRAGMQTFSYLAGQMGELVPTPARVCALAFNPPE
jgi:hypothetical protein